jgi:hypothetical protein
MKYHTFRIAFQVEHARFTRFCPRTVREKQRRKGVLSPPRFFSVWKPDGRCRATDRLEHQPHRERRSSTSRTTDTAHSSAVECHQEPAATSRRWGLNGIGQPAAPENFLLC